MGGRLVGDNSRANRCKIATSAKGDEIETGFATSVRATSLFTLAVFAAAFGAVVASGCEAASGLRQPVFTDLFQKRSCDAFVSCGIFASAEACIAATDNVIDDDDLVPDCPCYDAVAARECITALEEDGATCSTSATEVTYPESCQRICCSDECTDSACEVLGVTGEARCEKIYANDKEELKNMVLSLVGEDSIAPECALVPNVVTDHPDRSVESKLPVPEMDLEAVYFSQSPALLTPPSLTCGAKNKGVTLCTSAMISEGPVYTVAYQTRAAMPFADSDLVYQVGFAFNADNIRENNFVPPEEFSGDYFQNTDKWYVADYSPSVGWRISAYTATDGEVVSVPSEARYLLSDTVGALVVPADEIAAYDPEVRISIFRHDGSLGLELPNNWDGSVYPKPLRPLLRRILRRPF